MCWGGGVFAGWNDSLDVTHKQAGEQYDRKADKYEAARPRFGEVEQVAGVGDAVDDLIAWAGEDDWFDVGGVVLVALGDKRELSVYADDFDDAVEHRPATLGVSADDDIADLKAARAGRFGDGCITDAERGLHRAALDGVAVVAEEVGHRRCRDQAERGQQDGKGAEIESARQASNRR